MAFIIPICRAYIGRRYERNQVVSCALIKTLLLVIVVARAILEDVSEKVSKACGEHSCC